MLKRKCWVYTELLIAYSAVWGYLTLLQALKYNKKGKVGSYQMFLCGDTFFLSSQLTTLPADSPAAHIQDEHIQRNLTVDNFWKEAYQFKN